MRVLLSFCALFATAATVSAEPPLRNIEWPSAARPRIAVSSKDELFDGVQTSIYILSVADIRLRLTSIGPWQRSARTDPHYSILFEHYSNPDVQLGIAVFSPEEFLPDLGRPTWDAYLAGLRARHGDALLSLAEAGTVDGGDYLFILGRPYREVTYFYLDPSTRRKQGRRELFVLAHKHLFAFVVQGPEDSIRFLATPVERFVGKLSFAN